SQRVVESLLGRLITDAEFRREFHADPSGTCRREGTDVTARELEAMLRIGEAPLAEMSKRLDLRIMRAVNNESRLFSSAIMARPRPQAATLNDDDQPACAVAK